MGWPSFLGTGIAQMLIRMDMGKYIQYKWILENTSWAKNGLRAVRRGFEGVG